MANLEKIIQEKEAAEAELFKLPGVTGVDVGYKYVDGQRTEEISIRVHVTKKKKGLSKADQVPAEIAGIKTDVIENVIVPFVLKMSIEEIQLLADTTKYAPVKGGISIGPERVIGGSVYTGTLGCIVRDNVSGNPFLLSNFHVMAINNTGTPGDQMCQPSRVDGGVAVTDRVGTLQRSVLSAHVDGAVSSLSGRSHDCSIVDIGLVSGKAAAVLNAAVRKRGRTTLLTHGFVDGINATVSINYGPGIGVRILTNQIGIRPDIAHNTHFSKRGDSGSVVVDRNNKVIGLLFGGDLNTGYTYINPIDYVLSELNITLCVRTKSTIKDILDNKNNRKDFKEGKELIKDRKEFKEGKEFIKEFKEFKEFDKSVPDFPGKGLRENPGGFDPRENPIGVGGQTNDTVDNRLGNIEQVLGELTAFISGSLRPDLTQGAFSNEEDYVQARTSQKEEQDNLGAKVDADNWNG